MELPKIHVAATTHRTECKGRWLTLTQGASNTNRAVGLENSPSC